MNAKEIIELLRTDTRKLASTNIREALCWYLYKKQVPCTIIAKAMKCQRRVVYHRMYSCRDLLSTNNIAMKEAYNEISSHKIMVKPMFIETEACVFFKGYSIVIDNEIY